MSLRDGLKILRTFRGIDGSLHLCPCCAEPPCTGGNVSRRDGMGRKCGKNSAVMLALPSAAVHIINAHNVILFQVRTTLDFNDFQRFRTPVRQPVPRLLRNDNPLS